MAIMVKKDKDFDEVVDKAIKFWVGKPNNPLNGLTLTEIYNLVKEKGGYENLGSLNAK